MISQTEKEKRSLSRAMQAANSCAKQIVRQILIRDCFHTIESLNHSERLRTLNQDRSSLSSVRRVRSIYSLAIRLLAEFTLDDQFEMVPYCIDLSQGTLLSLRDEIKSLRGGFEDLKEEFEILTLERERLPANWLAQSYESLLAYELNECTTELLDDRKSKKRSGIYYTSDQLAEFTVRTGLHHLVWDVSSQSYLEPEQIMSLRVVDPAIGGGAFLLAAADFLTDALISSIKAHRKVNMFETLGLSRNCPERSLETSARAQVVQNCLYGVDVDAGAVEIATLSLVASVDRAYRSEVFRQLSRKLKCGNSLVGVWNSASDHDADRGQLDHVCMNYFKKRDKRGRRFSESILTEEQILQTFGFFHWSDQFPELFSSNVKENGAGFDAVIGNPPWEIKKKNSREFFDRYISDIWQLGKQEALERQNALQAQNREMREQWLAHSNEPELFATYIEQSKNYVLQGGSDVNAYKLFLELALRLCKEGGVVSLVVPAGVYTDKGCARIRHELLAKCNWMSLHGFNNTRGIFDIHRSFKFCVLCFKTGSKTEIIHVSFGNDTVFGVEAKNLVQLDRQTLERFSPNHFSIPEIESDRDLEIFDKIAASSITFEEFIESRRLKYAREFDMTNDSHLFQPVYDMEQRDQFKADRYGHWLKGNWRKRSGAHSLNMRAFEAGNDRDHRCWLEPVYDELIVSSDGCFEIALSDVCSIAYPLYEGRMIGQFDDAAKGWLRGKGRQAVWTFSQTAALLPQYLVPGSNFRSSPTIKTGFLAVGSPTNTRSMIAACLTGFPCGNSVPVFGSDNYIDILMMTALLNSFVFDYILRTKMSGNNLNLYLLQECFVPSQLLSEQLVLKLSSILSFRTYRNAADSVRSNHFCFGHHLSDQEDLLESRVVMRSALDAIIARSYGLTASDLAYILRDCDREEEELRQSSFSERLACKGFWRVDKNKPAAYRQTSLTLAMFRELEESGIDALGRQILNVDRPAVNCTTIIEHAKLIDAIRSSQ